MFGWMRKVRVIFLDALSRGDWMDTINMGGWMDALRRGGWMNALSRLVGWMR